MKLSGHLSRSCRGETQYSLSTYIHWHLDRRWWGGVDGSYAFLHCSGCSPSVFHSPHTYTFRIVPIGTLPKFCLPLFFSFQELCCASLAPPSLPTLLYSTHLPSQLPYLTCVHFWPYSSLEKTIQGISSTTPSKRSTFPTVAHLKVNLTLVAAAEVHFLVYFCNELQ